MYNFENTIDNIDIHTSGIHNELSKHFPFALNLEPDEIIKYVEVESQAAMEMRQWGIKSIDLYTTQISLHVSFLDHDSRKFKVTFDKEWKIEDEFEGNRVVGIQPTSIYIDFNKKTITVYYS